MEYLEVFIPLFALIINAAVQVMGFRYLSSLAMLRSIILGFSVGLIFVFIVDLYMVINIQKTATEALGDFSVNIITYIVLGYCYFHFLNLGETARRIRILWELYDAGKGLSMEEILARYNAGNIIDRRLDRVLGNKQIIYRDGRYFVGQRLVLLMAKATEMMKLIMLGKRSECG